MQTACMTDNASTIVDRQLNANITYIYSINAKYRPQSRTHFLQSWDSGLRNF